MVQYQLTGCDSTATLSALVLDSVAPSISSGANVVDITMKIQKFFMDRTFGVIVVDGATSSNDTLCTRSNIIQANLQLLQAKYQTADDILTANSVGKALGMSVPVSNGPRLKELIDIMTQATQDTLATEIANVKTNSLSAAGAAICGGTAKSFQIDASTGVKLVRAAVTGNGAAKSAFSTALAKAMAKYMDSGFSGAAVHGEATAPTDAVATINDGAQVNNLVQQIILQANNLGTTNKLFGAASATGAPVPELTDGIKAFHFLHFDVGDVLTFKNTVTIVGGGDTIILNFNLTVAGDTDADNGNFLTLGSNLGAAFAA